MTALRWPWPFQFLEERVGYKWIHVFHFASLMVVTLSNSIAWIHYAPKAEDTLLNITANTILQGLCNTALLIWKAVFFSFNVLKEEETSYIVIQIVCAIVFETLLPRIYNLWFIFLFFIWHTWYNESVKKMLFLV